MENNQDSSIFEFNIDEESKSNFASIAQWANINAIVGFAGIGISVIAFVVSLFRVTSSAASTAFVPGLFSITIGLILSLVLNVTLIGAAINIKKALDLSNQNHFVTGLSKMATYFKIFGILIIIGMVLVVLVFVFGLLFGVGSRF